MSEKSYVIITAARNEEAYVERTIKSVMLQTILPRKWVIVSDGSTDRTDEMVREYATKYNFIQFIRVDSGGNRNFASKIHAFNRGYEQLKDIEYDFIGNLDADISFEPNYYERILKEFQNNLKLGIGGGIIFDLYGKDFRKQLSNLRNVAGAIQMFRRRCYEDIGGYIPLEKGGIDAVAEIMARMHRWEVRSFPDIKVLHHRRSGLSYGNILVSRFQQGVRVYSYGNHPLFEMARCLLRVREKPHVFGSILRLSGYCWAFLRRVQREVPDNVVDFLRGEQMQRLRDVFSRK